MVGSLYHSRKYLIPSESGQTRIGLHFNSLIPKDYVLEHKTQLFFFVSCFLLFLLLLFGGCFFWGGGFIFYQFTISKPIMSLGRKELLGVK